MYWQAELGPRGKFTDLGAQKQCAQGRLELGRRGVEGWSAGREPISSDGGAPLPGNMVFHPWGDETATVAHTTNEWLQLTADAHRQQHQQRQPNPNDAGPSTSHARCSRQSGITAVPKAGQLRPDRHSISNQTNRASSPTSISGWRVRVLRAVSESPNMKL